MLINSFIKTFLGDLSTPVGIYLRIRDLYPESCLLESGEYNRQENSSTVVGINPLKTFRRDSRNTSTSDLSNSFSDLKDFYKSFKVEVNYLNQTKNKFKSFNGLIGYISFDSIPLLENITFKGKRQEERRIPEIQYSLYEYIIEVNHFTNILTITKNCLEENLLKDNSVELSIDKLYETITNNNISEIDLSKKTFSLLGSETSNMDDDLHYKIIEKCKEHIQRGDVFQIVTSRRYSQDFSGDDFQVYRTLRAVNTSPFLYYYDGGGFKLFGSSPEAQLKIKNGIASSFPIAGTCQRTGDEKKDKENSLELLNDPKENSEHVMLVDLARNDLSRFCKEVNVPLFKEVQYYSHVIHLVSRVEGKIENESSPIDLLTSTFPAGTLSGAPKYRAMQIINDLEPDSRENYAGAIGLIDFSGDLIHAIMIRSFMSKDSTLHYQAGAGIVSESVPESEILEVKNKLGALRKALLMAEGIL